MICAVRCKKLSTVAMLTPAMSTSLSQLLEREPIELDRLRYVGVAVLTVAVLLPFVGKAFHIDDPIFLWTAEQIAHAPLDFSGFDVNWYGVLEPMHGINKNPPLVSYYLAVMGSLFGWSETALHLSMFGPALGFAFGVSRLAGMLKASPLVAGAIAVCTPAFLVSATSLMSDVGMLALWCWALVFFLRGFESERLLDWIVAGVLVGLCIMTKYFGLALLPLMALYGLARRPGVLGWWASIAVGLAIAVAFDVYTHALYGLHPLLDVMGYATTREGLYSVPFEMRAAVGALFLGGCTVGTLLFAPLLWKSRGLLGLGFAASLMAILCVWVFADQNLDTGIKLHQAVFAAAAVHLVAVALREFARERSPDVLLLVAWLFGVFVFASFTNWTTNGRSILPAIPAIAILLARALAGADAARAWVVVPVLALSLLLSLAVANADAKLAGSARSAAQQLVERHREGTGRLYFQGSWGFQRYMEQAGVAKMALGQTAFEPGDRIILPGNNTNLIRIPEGRAKRIAVESFAKSEWISILSHPRSAGFYASVWGSLPYSFGATVNERYGVYEFTRSWAPDRRGGPRSKKRVRETP